MIIVKIIGGLGNQLFQYATGRHLAIVQNTILKLDVSGFRDHDQRQYALSHFNIQEIFASDQEIKQLIVPKQTTIGRALHNIFHNHPKKPKSYIRVKSPCFNPNILKLPDNVYLEGYWQSEKYFSESSEVIRSEFSLKEKQSGRNKKMAEHILSTQSVSIHIRRGDYVSDPKTSQTHGTCSLDYYQRCIQEITEKIANPNFFVFSDDIEWCRENLKISFPAEFIDHNSVENAHEDLRLMSLCKHNIIANSSFSWWAAWLNPNKEKLVFAPKKWFNTDKYIMEDIIPQEWSKI